MEAQIEESRSARPTKAKRALKAAQAQNHIKKADLVLSRSRVVQQLEHSTNERFIELMRRTLADLDKQIADLAD
ncbi:MAG TPA: hypothetical protein VIH91_00325 [Terriglobales bacterium]